MNMHFTKFDVVVQRLRSTQGHYLNNLDITGVPDATYQLSMVLEKILKVFSPYLGMKAMLVM